MLHVGRDAADILPRRGTCWLLVRREKTCLCAAGWVIKCVDILTGTGGYVGGEGVR